VLRGNDGLRNKVSTIIRRNIDNEVATYMYVFYYYHALSYSLGSIFISANMVVFLFNTVIYFHVFEFLLYVYVSSSSQLALFGYPDRGFPCFFPQL